jgi:hypothetical protein
VRICSRCGEDRRQIDATGDDLRVLADQELIILKMNERGNPGSFAIKQSAIDAVQNDFKRPSPAAPFGATFHQTFYAPVGAFHTGPGNISIETQNVGVTGEELVAIFTDLRRMISELPANDQAEAVDFVDDLEEEARAKVPKQSRIKAALLALWNVSNKAVELATKLAQLGAAYGLDPSKLRLH